METAIMEPVLISPICKYDTLASIESLDTEFLFPKLVIFENNQLIRIIDVDEKNREKCLIGEYATCDYEIVDRKLFKHYLWLLLTSGEIAVVNVVSTARLTLNVDNYRIRQFRCYGHNFYLISEGGEVLTPPYSAEDLDRFITDGVANQTTSLSKANINRTEFSDESKNYINGLHLTVQDKKTIVKCPLTGLQEEMFTNNELEKVIPWGDIALLANKNKMWNLDIKNAQVEFTFENAGLNYLPVKVFGGVLYYLMYSPNEIQICCAWRSSLATFENHPDVNFRNNSITTQLSSEESLKLQLKSLADNALLEGKPEDLIPMMLGLFDKINDYAFVINIGSQLCQHNIAYKSLMYFLQKNIHANNDAELINTLNEIIIKVDLLEYIIFRGCTTYQDINVFELSFKQMCVTFISNLDFDLASICWLKYSEMKLIITPNDLVDILNAIPHNVKMGALVILLRNIAPTLLEINPYFIDVFVRWTTERVFTLEQSGYWPKVGTKFLEEIISVMETSFKTIFVRPISMDDLDILKDHISYITDLKEKYKINMLLGELSSQSPSEVSLIMLQRCYTEDLQDFLQEFMVTYSARYLLDIDDTIRTFIENYAASSGGTVDGSRLQILLNAFRSPSNKLDCLLQVLKVLDVPWHPLVLDIAVEAAANASKDFTMIDGDRLLAQEVKKEIYYAKVKVVLKKYNFPLMFNDYNMVLHKIINAPVTDLNDLRTVTNVMTTYTNYGNVLYINRCLRDCETKVALGFFNEMGQREKKVLIKAMLTKYEQIINSPNNDSKLERNYLDFLKGTQMLNQIQVTNIEHLYHLKNSYDIQLNLNNIYNEKHCSNEANYWMNEDGTTASSGRGGCVAELTRMHKSQDSVLLTLLRKTSSSHAVRNFVENVINLDEKSSISACKESVLSPFRDGNNSSLLIEACNVIVHIISKTPEEYLHFLITQLSMLNSLVNAHIVVKNLAIAWKFHYIFIPMSSLSSINDLLNHYSKDSGDEFHLDFANNSNRSDFIPIRIIADIVRVAGVTGNQLGEDFLVARDRIAQRILSKVLASQDIDEVLVTCLLLIVSRSESIGDKMWILDTIRGSNESLSPAILNYLSAPIIRRTFDIDDVVPGNTMSYPPQYMLKSKFNINLTDIALPDSTEETWDVKVVLFYVLRQYPETTFDRLMDICGCLNVTVNDGLSLQLISLLTTWDLKYKIIINDLGCREVVMENDEKQLLQRCLLIWESVDDKVFLKDILNDFWKNGEVTLHGRVVSINPYFYEIYLCIYHLIFGSTSESKNIKQYFLLNFLKEYRRKSTPKQYEFELFSVKGMFPEIGHYRLPFHLFMRDDMWSNLKSEITLETYERWLPVVVLLSLDADQQTAKDMICSNALKQTMTSRKRNQGTEADTKESEPWRLSTREEPLLRAAHRCVRHIANMEWAGACLFYVLQGCTRGADQVAAAQLCYQFAQRWAALQPGNRAVRQMERLHSTLSTRHALYKISWACEEFVRLSAEPAQLIRAIYLHTDFVDKMKRQDVNRAANEIADKNGINVSSIRIQILENILDKSNNENKLKTSPSLDRTELMTAKYILKATCPKMGAIYLSRIAFDDESDYNRSKKLRAHQCLMSVVEPDTSMKVTNRKRDALWNSLLELFCVVNLENIDMPWVVSTFMQDKIRAFEQLLQSATGNVQALKIAAEIGYKYGDMQGVRQLIQPLLRAGLYDEAIPLLLKLSYSADDLILAAWRTIIVAPFKQADYPITERQKIKCLNSINLLPVCPIVKDEDLLEIWKNCVRCKCFGLGCLVLPYMTVTTRQKLEELRKIDKRNLIASLKNLHTETYLVSGAMRVVENLGSKLHR